MFDAFYLFDKLLRKKAGNFRFCWFAVFSACEFIAHAETQPSALVVLRSRIVKTQTHTVYVTACYRSREANVPRSGYSS